MACPPDHPKRASETRYTALLDVVQTSTKSPLAFLVHESGTLLAARPSIQTGDDLAYQVSSLVEVADRIVRDLNLQDLNLALLDCTVGRVLLVRAGRLILGCVIHPTADVSATVRALHHAFGTL